jgi:hypothetical protein
MIKPELDNKEKQLDFEYQLKKNELNFKERLSQTKYMKCQRA